MLDGRLRPCIQQRAGVAARRRASSQPAVQAMEVAASQRAKRRVRLAAISANAGSSSRRRTAVRTRPTMSACER
jgi:hypothetical protein